MKRAFWWVVFLAASASAVVHLWLLVTWLREAHPMIYSGVFACVYGGAALNGSSG